MPHSMPLLATLAIGFVMAFLFGSLAQRLRTPPLVGYLLAGMVVGPFTPGFVADAGIAGELAEIGVILLMFGVGLHFSLKDLMEVRTVALPGAIAQIAFVTLLGYGFGWSLGWSPMDGLVFGLALSVASTVVVMRALEERRLLDTRRGKIAVGWLIVEDLAMVLALVLLPAVAGSMGAGDGKGGSIWAALALTFVKVAGFVAVMLIVGRRVIPSMLERVAATGSRELFTLCVLAIALGVAFGAAKLFDVSFALGAFFAGMLLNESELSHKAAADSLPMRDAFAVLFFVSVGMLFNPGILIAHPWLVLATLAIIIIGNGTIAFAIVRLLKLPVATALTIAVSLSQIGEFSFILAGLGLAQGMLSQQGHDLILAGALLSIIANPFLFTWLARWQARNIAGTPLPPKEAAPGPSLDLDAHAIVIGYGRVGSTLAGLLRDRGMPVLIIDDNIDHVVRAHAAGIPGIRGSAASDQVLAEAQPGKARIAILAIPQPLEAGETLAKLRAINPALTLLARAHSDAEVEHLMKHGADGVVMAERELAHSLAEMVMAAPAAMPAA
ncbi:YbaL family putative K(+) efflux transporter [Arenimonas sp.]|uniref:YbaL family putative K(+) efflux transporter n=1 Tax=Arenimonas sp. TaxID=1872635 RepID=UPI0039E4FFB9